MLIVVSSQVSIKHETIYVKPLFKNFTENIKKFSEIP